MNIDKVMYEYNVSEIERLDELLTDPKSEARPIFVAMIKERKIHALEACRAYELERIKYLEGELLDRMD